MSNEKNDLSRFAADASDIVMMGTITSVEIAGGEPDADSPLDKKKAKIDPALIGKAGEVLVAGELMRRGIDVAYPASDKGIDMLAYRLNKKQVTARHFVPVQVKSRAESGFNFHRIWFDKVPGVTLVHVWNLQTKPEFYIFSSISQVEEVLDDYAQSPSWRIDGKYNVTKAQPQHYAKMFRHKDQWNRILDQL